MSSKMYLLSFIANCDVYDVEPIAVSSKVKNLKARAKLHLEDTMDDNDTLGKWSHAYSWCAPVLSNGEDSQEMFYSIQEVEEV